MSKHKGSSFDSFLDERGLKEEVHLRAKKSILVDELLDAMKTAKVTRAELAKRMETSRTEVYRLLDPDNTGVTLATLARATIALGLDFRVSVTVAKRRARAA
jgi:antitoxin HicB